MKEEHHLSNSESSIPSGAILIFGMRRSGTTWLAKIVDSHPDTLYRHEPDSWIGLSDIPYYADIDQNSSAFNALSRFYQELYVTTLPHVVAKSPFFKKNYLSVEQKYRQIVQAFVSKSLKRFFGIGIKCYNAIPSLGNKEFRLAWKSVESPGRLAYISSVSPNIRAVFLIRHPCGYFNSYLRGQAIGKMPKTSDDEFNVDMWRWRIRTGTAKSYDLTMETVVGWSRKERMIWEWVIDNQFALESTGELENVKVVVYDELCKMPSTMASEIFTHLQLNWNSQTLEFLDQGKRKKRSSYFSVFKDPALTADAWKHQLSKADQQLVIDIVRNTLPANLFEDSFDIE